MNVDLNGKDEYSRIVVCTPISVLVEMPTFFRVNNPYLQNNSVKFNCADEEFNGFCIFFPLKQLQFFYFIHHWSLYFLEY